MLLVKEVHQIWVSCCGDGYFYFVDWVNDGEWRAAQIGGTTGWGAITLAISGGTHRPQPKSWPLEGALVVSDLGGKIWGPEAPQWGLKMFDKSWTKTKQTTSLQCKGTKRSGPGTGVEVGGTKGYMQRNSTRGSPGGSWWTKFHRGVRP